MTTHLWEVDGDGVVMPLVVADLRDLPAPLGRFEDVEVLATRLLAQQEHEATVVDEERVVVSVHI